MSELSDKLGFESGFAQTNGIKLHYVSKGEGPLVILLHGFPEFWYSWRHQIEALSPHFKVVAPDLRGYNLSDKPKGAKNYVAKELADDVRGVIHHFGKEKAIIVGHDWGGGVAYAFVRRYLEMTEKLVILNSPHPAIFQKDLRKNFNQLRKSWYMFFFQLPLVPELVFKLFMKKLMTDSFRGWAVHKENFPDEDIDLYCKAFGMPGVTTAAINYYRAFLVEKNEKGTKLHKHITCPSMVIWGEQDQALGKQLTIGLEKYHSGPFELKMIPDASHWVQNDCPEKVNKHLLEFLT